METGNEVLVYPRWQPSGRDRLQKRCKQHPEYVIIIKGTDKKWQAHSSGFQVILQQSIERRKGVEDPKAGQPEEETHVHNGQSEMSATGLAQGARLHAKGPWHNRANFVKFNTYRPVRQNIDLRAPEALYYRACGKTSNPRSARVVESHGIQRVQL